MGALILPASGLVYLDANPIIFTVEKHSAYGPLLHPLWQAARAKAVEVVSSDLVLMEVLVGPLKKGDSGLARAYQPVEKGIPEEKAGHFPNVFEARFGQNRLFQQAVKGSS